MIELPKPSIYQPLEIYWLDIKGDSGEWLERKEFDLERPAIIKSLGYLEQVTEERILMSACISFEIEDGKIQLDGGYGRTLRIPVGCIIGYSRYALEMQVLKPDYNEYMPTILNSKVKHETKVLD